MNVATQFPATPDSERDLPFQAMFEAAAIGIGICRLDGQIVEANPALCRMLGYSRQELSGAHARELYPELDRELRDGRLDELVRGERDSFQVEKRFRRKDGSELWGYLTLSVARDRHRQPAFLIATLADATKHRRTEECLRQAEKMEVIGRLAAGIAHDFNNLLTGVLLYCDLLTAGLGNARLGKAESANSEFGNAANAPLEPNEMSQHINEVRMAGEQGAALTQQLLAIARKQTSERRATPINEIVASTKNLLRRLLGERIELIIVLDTALDTTLDTAFDTAPAAGRDSGEGLVLADPAQLRQILLNLVLNARDAMPQGGKIGLITRAAEFPSQLPAAGSNELHKLAPGSPRKAVSLLVKDNGCGMDAETRARLFEPFFTTKKGTAGTGLGLATVQRIVGELGGVIEVESEPGHGTSIEVVLPTIRPATVSP
ncbi:MAG: PAS domain S-box protein [Terriglobales bacterium]